jgi:signal peptidase II
VTADSHQRGGPGLRRASIAASVAAVVVLVDQLTKWWAVTRLSTGPIHVIGTLDFELTRNTGASFSIFTGRAALIIPVVLVVAAGLCAMAWRAPTNARAAIFGLIIGGALGNLCDRIFRGDHGAVVDFVALHFWPTFNVADSCITVGCVLLLVSWARAPRPG